MTNGKSLANNKIVIITGSASGIGKATAKIFAREQATVICTDIDESSAQKISHEINKSGGNSYAFGVDVTSRDAINHMVSEVVTKFGRIDFLFNSAGSILERLPFLEISDDIWDKTFDLNVKGTFYTMQSVLPEMLKKGNGVIVNMASMAHLNGSPKIAINYGASKGAVVTMSKGVAREFADQGIRCVSISPGPIDTPFQETASEEIRTELESWVPMGRYGKPEEIGELVLFICSGKCDFMTADTILVNGGGGFR